MRAVLSLALILTLLLFPVSTFDRSVRVIAAQDVQVRIEGKGRTIFNGQAAIEDNCSVITEDGEIEEIEGPMAICALQNASLQGGFNLNVQNTSLGLFLEGIAEVRGDWRYWVNKQYAPVGFDSYPLKTGDNLVLNVDDPNFPEEKIEIKTLEPKKESSEPRSEPGVEEVSQTQSPKTKTGSSKPQIDNQPLLLTQTLSKPLSPIPTPSPTISQAPTPEPKKQTQASPIPVGSLVAESKPKTEIKTEPNVKTGGPSPTQSHPTKPENPKPQIDLPKKEEEKESNILISSEVKSPSIKKDAPSDLPRTGREGFPLGVGLSFLFGGILLKLSFLNKNYLPRSLKPARKTKNWYYY